MHFSIEPGEGYLRAELVERETGGETREFLEALAAECLRRGLSSVLICVRASRPIFRVEQYRASFYLQELACRPDYRVALVASRPDIRAAHEYLEVLAGQHGAHLRSFSHEAMAIEWLRSAKRVARETQRRPAKSP